MKHFWYVYFDMKLSSSSDTIISSVMVNICSCMGVSVLCTEIYPKRQVCWIWWLRHDYGVVLPKNYKQTTMCGQELYRLISLRKYSLLSIRYSVIVISWCYNPAKHWAKSLLVTDGFGFSLLVRFYKIYWHLEQYPTPMLPVIALLNESRIYAVTCFTVKISKPIAWRHSYQHF